MTLKNLRNIQLCPQQKKLGHDIVTQLSPICENISGMPLSKVFSVIQNSQILKLLNASAGQKQKYERRKNMRGAKEKVQLELQKHDSDLVFQRRLSFRKYNTIRLIESFETV